MKLMRGYLQDLRTKNSILQILVLIILLMPVVQANYINEVKEKALELETPNAIHSYLWMVNNYKYLDYKKSLSKYWNDGIGDCTEVARLEYIMFKAIGYKARISHGYLEGFKHDYSEYYENNTWISPIKNITRKGRGIW